jgi:hypothetical protein
MPIKAYAIEDLSQAHIERWNELLLASPSRTAFLSYAFCRAVADVRGGVTVLHIQDFCRFKRAPGALSSVTPRTWHAECPISSASWET